MKNRYERRRVLQDLLARETGCFIQHTGWCCNRCFHSMDFDGVSDDHLHELWQSTLLLRGDYRNGEEITQTDKQLSDNIDELIGLLTP